MEEGEKDVLRQISPLGRELRVGPQGLLVQAEDSRRKKAHETERLALLLGEGHSMGEAGFGQELAPPKRGLYGGRSAFHAVTLWEW